MLKTRTHLLSISLLSLTLSLVACSSKKSGFLQQQEDERWFCTPKPGEEWLCQESDNQFKQLALEQAREEKIRQQEAQAQLESDVSVTSDSLEVEPAIAEDESLLVTKQQGHEKATTDSSQVIPVESVGSEITVSVEAKVNLEQEDLATLQQEPNDITPWVIQLAAYKEYSSASALSKQVEGSEIYNTQVKGQSYVTVVIVGFNSRQQASLKAEQIIRQHPQLSPWVRKGSDFKRYIIQ